MSASLALAASLGPFPLSIPWTEAAGRQNRQSRQRTKAETGRQGRAVRMCACVCIQCAWLGPLLTSLALCLLPSSLRFFLPPQAVCLPSAATRLPGGWLLSTLPASRPHGPVDSHASPEDLAGGVCFSRVGHLAGRTELVSRPISRVCGEVDGRGWGRDDVERRGVRACWWEWRKADLKQTHRGSGGQSIRVNVDPTTGADQSGANRRVLHAPTLVGRHS